MDLTKRLRNPTEQNALIVRRSAADLIDELLVAADELPLWRLEDADISDDEFEAVTRFRALIEMWRERR